MCPPPRHPLVCNADHLVNCQALQCMSTPSACLVILAEPAATPAIVCLCTRCMDLQTCLHVHHVYCCTFLDGNMIDASHACGLQRMCSSGCRPSWDPRPAHMQMWDVRCQPPQPPLSVRRSNHLGCLERLLSASGCDCLNMIA